MIFAVIQVRGGWVAQEESANVLAGEGTEVNIARSLQMNGVRLLGLRKQLSAPKNVIQNLHINLYLKFRGYASAVASPGGWEKIADTVERSRAIIGVSQT